MRAIRFTWVLVPFLCFALLSSTAEAFHRRDLPIVQNLSHQLHNSAIHVRLYAQARANQFNHWERQMLAALYQFELASGRFHNVLHHWWANQQMVLVEWNRTVDYAYQVHYAIPRSHHMRGVIHRWNECIRELQQIRWYLGQEGGRHMLSGMAEPPTLEEERSLRFDVLHGDKE